MAIPALVAGAGLASRGLASYLAKQKAKKEMMKTGYGATRNASIPNLVSSRIKKPDMRDIRAYTIPAAATGTALYGLNSLSNHPRNKAMDRRREGTYMANPMMGKSQNPSYDASMTMDGQIQTMMEEMDGMDLSEDAKLKIIEDKLGFTNGFSQPEDIANTGTAITANEINKIEENNFKTKLKKYGPLILDPTGFNRKLYGGPYDTIKMFMGRPIQ